MYMRIIWGRIVTGQWDGFEAAYKKATSLRGDVKGLKNQWLARDQGDPDAGYSITLASSGEQPCARTTTPLSRVWHCGNRTSAGGLPRTPVCSDSFIAFSNEWQAFVASRVKADLHRWQELAGARTPSHMEQLHGFLAEGR